MSIKKGAVKNSLFFWIYFLCFIFIFLNLAKILFSSLVSPVHHARLNAGNVDTAYCCFYFFFNRNERINLSITHQCHNSRSDFRLDNRNFRTAEILWSIVDDNLWKTESFNFILPLSMISIDTVCATASNCSCCQPVFFSFLTQEIQHNTSDYQYD